MKTFLASLRLLSVLTLLTGAAYPLLVWAVGQAAFRERAEGSLLRRGDVVVGSALLAQKTANPRYFSPRPSGADYATVASGASNAAWTNAKLVAAHAERREAWRGIGRPPADLIAASGSGLDPEVSPASIAIQLDRVARERGLSAAQRRELDDLVAAHTAGGQLSPMRVNVLQLNLALDARFP